MEVERTTAQLDRPPSDAVETRLASLKSALDAERLDAYLSLKLVNTYYLSGFTSLDTARPNSYTRPIAVVVPAGGDACLVIPELDAEAARDTAAFPDIRTYGKSPAVEAARELVLQRLRESGATRVGVEEDTFTTAWLSFFGDRAPEVEFVPASTLVERLRIKKDEGEIATLREAARLSDLAMAASLGASAAGVSELASETQGLVALREAAALRGEASIVDVISLILGGPRGAMPHEFTTGRLYGSGELMWHCWLVAYQGYWVENVRTGIIGSSERSHDATYEVLLQSLLAGQDAARPGAVAGDVFRAVMGVLKSRPLPGFVITRSGHGMGLEYHEPPFVEDTDETVLESGVVLTVEPGVWIPGVGGLTLSNTLVVRDGEPEVLITAPLSLHRAA
jgi:Xaa-Pro aminopeptidase